VSSSRVRDLLQQGDVAGAATLLLRVHEVEGDVVRGDGRGRTIGFPTANLQCDPVLLPAEGVYAVVARDLTAPGAPLLRGVANLGRRPTFAAGPAVEVHLFDFDDTLYGHRLRVGFVDRVRGEKRFEGVQALTAQIGRDVETARVALARIDAERLAWV
jgi:riboflavin kinase / FMN adenylyltransferase